MELRQAQISALQINNQIEKIDWGQFQSLYRDKYPSVTIINTLAIFHVLFDDQVDISKPLSVNYITTFVGWDRLQRKIQFFQEEKIDHLKLVVARNYALKNMLNSKIDKSMSNKNYSLIPQLQQLGEMMILNNQQRQQISYHFSPETRVMKSIMTTAQRNKRSYSDKQQKMTKFQSIRRLAKNYQTSDQAVGKQRGASQLDLSSHSVNNNVRSTSALSKIQRTMNDQSPQLIKPVERKVTQSDHNDKDKQYTTMKVGDQFVFCESKTNTPQRKSQITLLPQPKAAPYQQVSPRDIKLQQVRPYSQQILQPLKNGNKQEQDQDTLINQNSKYGSAKSSPMTSPLKSQTKKLDGSSVDLKHDPKHNQPLQKSEIKRMNERDIQKQVSKDKYDLKEFEKTLQKEKEKLKEKELEKRAEKEAERQRAKEKQRDREKGSSYSPGQGFGFGLKFGKQFQRDEEKDYTSTDNKEKIKVITYPSIQISTPPRQSLHRASHSPLVADLANHRMSIFQNEEKFDEMKLRYQENATQRALKSCNESFENTGTSSEESHAEEESESEDEDKEKKFKIQILSELNEITEQKFTKQEYKYAIASLQQVDVLEENIEIQQHGRVTRLSVKLNQRFSLVPNRVSESSDRQSIIIQPPTPELNDSFVGRNSHYPQILEEQAHEDEEEEQIPIPIPVVVVSPIITQLRKKPLLSLKIQAMHAKLNAILCITKCQSPKQIKQEEPDNNFTDTIYSRQLGRKVTVSQRPRPSTHFKNEDEGRGKAQSVFGNKKV